MTEVRYVGWTINPRRRLGNHLREAKYHEGRDSDRLRWLRELLAKGLEPSLIILEKDPVGGWENAEPAWIASLLDLGCRLTNASDGGDGAAPGWKLSEVTKAKMRKPKSPETRKRMSDARKLRPPMSEETKKKISSSRTGKKYGPRPNTDQSGPKNPMYGRTHSADARKKMSDVAKTWIGEKNGFYGKTHTPETRAKISAARTGTPMSPEAKAKISAAMKANPPFGGRRHTVESRAKMSAAHLGTTMSPETRAKMSATQKGRKVSSETRAKLSVANAGKTLSLETRAKLSFAAHLRWHVNRGIVKEGCPNCEAL